MVNRLAVTIMVPTKE